MRGFKELFIFLFNIHISKIIDTDVVKTQLKKGNIQMAIKSHIIKTLFFETLTFELNLLYTKELLSSFIKTKWSYEETQLNFQSKLEYNLVNQINTLYQITQTSQQINDLVIN